MQIGMIGLGRIGGTAEQSYLHCGPNGAGHFVKMIHNGIEYGIMAAYAEGTGILKAANAGKSRSEVDAETTPLRDPEHYQYDFNLADISEVWRRASVIASWLLDLTTAALATDTRLANFGDAAYNKIFPSLQAMIKRGHLSVPVIGMAKTGCNVNQRSDAFAAA